MRVSQLLGVGALSVLACVDATAGDLVYTPVNPSFGGDSFNSQHLLGLANAQNEHKDDGKSEELSSSERFLQMLESRLYSSLAEQVSEAIFGEDAQDSGTITFQDQRIDFERVDGEIRLTILDFTTGQTTQIVVPTLQ